MESIIPNYIHFANKFGIMLKNERYLEWGIAESYEHSFKNFDVEVEMHKNQDMYYGNFDILDELLLKICPNILPLQYKLLYKNCVDFEVNYQDYHSLVKRCDIEKLFDFLVTNKLFIESDLKKF